MAHYEEFEIAQGADISIELELQNADGSRKNLTSHTITAHMRRNYTSDDYIAFNPLIASPAVNGICTLNLTNEQTSNLVKGNYVYDVELSYLDSDENTIVERILEGRITVTPSVTRT